MTYNTDRHLVLCFSSFVIPRDISRLRMEEYAICYEQLKRVLPNNFHLVFVDNTVSSIGEINNNRLVKALGDSSCLFYNYNVGLYNKGLGELQMMMTAENKLDFTSYKNIVYLTGRRFITCPYVFERTDRLDGDILVGNQPIINPFSGVEYPSGINMFGDMFFSMSSKKMIEYCRYVKTLFNRETSLDMGSEQILYSFINQHNYEFEEIKHLGFVRNDWELVDPSSYSRRVENFQVI